MGRQGIVMLTTVDTDIHVVGGEIDLVRMKVERNQWLLTIDGRYVRCNKVVSVWAPDEEELEGFLDSVGKAVGE